MKYGDKQMDAEKIATQNDWIGLYGVREINDKWYAVSDRGIMIKDNNEYRKATESEIDELCNYLKTEDTPLDEELIKNFEKSRKI